MNKIVLALTVATSLLTAKSSFSWEFTPTINGVVTQDDIGSKNHYGVGLRIAKNLEDALIDQVELGFEHSDSVDINNGQEFELTRYFSNINKNLYTSKDRTLYALLGGGYEDWSGRYLNVKSGGFIHYGFGVRYDFSDNFALKLELRDQFTFHDKNHNFIYSLGFGIGLGGTPKPISDNALVDVESDTKDLSANQDLDSKEHNMQEDENNQPSQIIEEETIIVPYEDLDDDLDGVRNGIDRCPNTEYGAVVDEFGCESIVHLDISVNFAFDSYLVSNQYKDKIKDVADAINSGKASGVLLEGNTDNVGTKAYNLSLSKKRAKAVADVLISYGVEPKKIKIEGLGDSNPVSSNDTQEGRAQNRRVDTKLDK